MEFTKRLSPPTESNQFYFENNVFYNSGYGMPNCTAYAWGRFYELTNIRPKLSTNNAENWFNFNLLSITGVSLNFTHKSRHYS